jgi:hypothetical protein
MLGSVVQVHPLLPFAPKLVVGGFHIPSDTVQSVYKPLNIKNYFFNIVPIVSSESDYILT